MSGRKIGLLAFTDNEPVWEATANQPGIFYVPTDLADSRATKLLDMIREGRKIVDVLLVSAHWGSDWGYCPPHDHIVFAHALIEAGADIIFGHSSHVFRGIEFYKGRSVLYGAGDFVDDYAIDEIERNDQSFIYVMEMAGKTSRGLSLYPTLIRGCHASLAEGVYALAIADKMTELCAAFRTSTRWNQVRRCIKIAHSNPGARVATDTH